MQSYVHGACDEALSYRTIGEALEHAAIAFRDSEALVSVHQKTRLTYAELDEKATIIAANLIKLGLEPGDRVGIWSPNCVEWTLIQYATAKAGIILVNINPAYRKSELAYALNKVGCRALVLADRFKTSNYPQMLVDLAPEIAQSSDGRFSSTSLPSLEFAVAIGETPQGFLPFGALETPVAASDRERVVEIGAELSPDDPINIQFTSGTTGAPKGATLSHFNILNNGYFTGQAMRLGAEDRLCVPVPLYHCFGMVMGNLACLATGATVVYPDAAFSPEATLAAVEGEKCTALYGVPAMFLGVLNTPLFHDTDVSSLRTGVMAGAPCPVELMKRVVSELHMPEVTIGYGMTETSPISFQSAVDDPLEKRVSTVGRIHPHVEVRIAGPDGATTKRGEKGELLTRGYSVMVGYWNDPEKTEEAIDSAGWMHTGDLAVIDDEGYCNIVGRIKDVIIRGGENIYPAEIEDFLYTHPEIQEVAVFGVPDEKYGEAVAAWIKTAGKEFSGEELRDFCANEIAHYKIPKFVSVVDDFPRTVTGKIQKFRMREAESEKRGLAEKPTA